jgi:hypothetical protein
VAVYKQSTFNHSGRDMTSIPQFKTDGPKTEGNTAVINGDSAEYEAKLVIKKKDGQPLTPDLAEEVLEVLINNLTDRGRRMSRRPFGRT